MSANQQQLIAGKGNVVVGVTFTGVPFASAVPVTYTPPATNRSVGIQISANGGIRLATRTTNTPPPVVDGFDTYLWAHYGTLDGSLYECELRYVSGGLTLNTVDGSLADATYFTLSSDRLFFVYNNTSGALSYVGTLTLRDVATHTTLATCSITLTATP